MTEAVTVQRCEYRDRCNQRKVYCPDDKLECNNYDMFARLETIELILGIQSDLWKQEMLRFPCAMKVQAAAPRSPGPGDPAGSEHDVD